MKEQKMMRSHQKFRTLLRERCIGVQKHKAHTDPEYNFYKETIFVIS